MDKTVNEVVKMIPYVIRISLWEVGDKLWERVGEE